MSTIFLPLKSNCGWFSSEDTHLQLGKRLKSFLLFYDEIAFENGRYSATFGESGSFKHTLPPDQIRDRSTIRYHEPGANFAVRVALTGSSDFQSVMGGVVVGSFEVDFWPLANEAGIAGAEYVKWLDVELTSQGKRVAQELSQRVRGDPAATRDLPAHRGIRDGIIDALHEDAILASALAHPMSTDRHAATLIEASNASATMQWSRDLVSHFHRSWLSLDFPDMGEEPWPEVLKKRESAAGQELRAIVARLADIATQIIAEGASDDDWEEILRNLLVREIIQEALSRRMTIAGAALNFGLNLIPYAGAALSSAKDVHQIVKHHHSWITLLAPPGVSMQARRRGD